MNKLIASIFFTFGNASKLALLSFFKRFILFCSRLALSLQRNRIKVKMVQIGDVILSMDIMQEMFCCDLDACKGLCCVEGDSGAPVEEEEKKKLEEVLHIVWDDLSEKAQEVIRRQGPTFVDRDGDLVTSIVDGKDCVFTCYDHQGCCFCAIEKAYREGKTDFYKPVSCHLYPIRAKQIGPYVGLNYHQWEICRAAVLKGRKEGIPVYRFLKEPLIRKFGEDWYHELEVTAAEMKRQHLI
jgi:hypothetical protein